MGLLLSLETASLIPHSTWKKGREQGNMRLEEGAVLLRLRPGGRRGEGGWMNWGWGGMRENCEPHWGPRSVER